MRRKLANTPIGLNRRATTPASADTFGGENGDNGLGDGRATAGIVAGRTNVVSNYRDDSLLAAAWRTVVWSVARTICPKVTVRPGGFRDQGACCLLDRMTSSRRPSIETDGSDNSAMKLALELIHR
jgi:hypothetical protein